MSSGAATTGDRFALVTSNDHSAQIWIAILLALIYSTLTFCTRIFIKYQMFGYDDWALVASQFVAYGQYAAVITAMVNGLGKAVELVAEERLSRLSTATFATRILVLASLCLSKCSVILLIQRVFTRDMKNFWKICNLILTACTLWGLGSILAISIRCSPARLIPTAADSSHCVRHLTRWLVICAVDVVTELVLVLLPVYLVWGLQMDVELKVRVVLAFAFRLPLAAFSILSVLRLIDSAHSGNPGVGVGESTIWNQVELGYSLISATIPCLKSFIKSFDTGLGLQISMYSNPSYHSNKFGSDNSRGYAGSYKLETLRAAGTPRSHYDSRSIVNKLRPERLKSSTAICADDARCDRHSGDDSGSQEMIIRRDLEWDVRHDPIA